MAGMPGNYSTYIKAFGIKQRAKRSSTKDSMYLDTALHYFYCLLCSGCGQMFSNAGRGGYFKRGYFKRHSKYRMQLNYPLLKYPPCPRC